MGAITTFIFVFILGFFLGGWFLMPYLPPTPNHPVNAFELEYWKTNWAGAVVGLIPRIIIRVVDSPKKCPDHFLKPHYSRVPLTTDN
jgi:hypothetical protein